MLRSAPKSRAFLALLAMALASCQPGDTGTDAGADIRRDGGDAALTCPEGQIPWPDGHCAPAIHTCPNPWEMPTVDGECVVVGPRACPKTWDPDSTADCKPGELLDCSAGFVLTEDQGACIPHFDKDCGEMEIPILGGGCKRVGVTEEELNLVMPQFGECGPGELALEGGGCILVGPRACPKLWDSESTAGCEIGDVAECPDGWVEGGDGAWCLPVYDECGKGERPLLGGGCQAVAGTKDECPVGPFPEPPGDSPGVVYVDAGSKCLENCGSVQEPAPSIKAGYDLVPQGGHLLIAAGTYDEGLRIDKPVQVGGLCAPLVKLTGMVKVEAEGAEKLDVAGVAVVAAAGVELSGITVQSNAVGIAAIGADDLAITQVEVEGANGVGIYLGDGADVAISDVWVHDSQPGAGPSMDGLGIWIVDKAVAKIDKTLVEENRSTGIYAAKFTSMVASDSVVRGTLPSATGFGGYGIRARSSTAILKDMVVEGNATMGVSSILGGNVTMDDSLVRGTVPDGNGQAGIGFDVRKGATGKIRRSAVLDNALSGIVVIDAGSELAVEGCAAGWSETFAGTGARHAYHAEEGGKLVVTGSAAFRAENVSIDCVGEEAYCSVSGSLISMSQQLPGEEAGVGVRCMLAASCEARKTVIQDSAGFGFFVVDEGTRLDLSESVVRDTYETPECEEAAGLKVETGAEAVVDGCLFERNENSAVAAVFQGAQGVLVKCEVRGTFADDDDDGDGGVTALDGGAISIQGSRVVDNVGRGVLAQSSGSTVVVEDSVIMNTVRQDDASNDGYGITAILGGSVSASRCLVESNQRSGVVVEGQGSTVILDEVLVRNSVPVALPEFDGELAYGWGISAVTGGHLVAGQSLVEANVGQGVSCIGDGAVVEFNESVVTGTLDKNGEAGGHGLWIGLGGGLTAFDTLVIANQGIGVRVGNPGSQATLEGVAVIDNVGLEGGGGGHGLSFVDSALVEVGGCLFQGNTALGIVGQDPGTELMLSDSVVRDTHPMENGQTGWGALWEQGITVTAARCLFEGNRSLGMLVRGAGAEVSLEACIVRDTQVNGDGVLGRGIDVDYGARLVAQGTLLQRNRGSGLAVAGMASSATVNRSIVRDTQINQTGAAGMGISAASYAMVDVRDTLLAGNATAGVATFGKGVLRLEGSAAVNTIPGGRTFAESGKEEETQIFGDGASCTSGNLDISSSVLSGNARCGVYFHESAGTLEETLLTGNGSFGLAMHKSEDQVAWEGLGNAIFGNGLNLPPAQAVDVTSSPGGLPTPPIPATVDLE